VAQFPDITLHAAHRAIAPDDVQNTQGRVNHNKKILLFSARNKSEYHRIKFVLQLLALR
jgi:hypothetical protein